MENALKAIKSDGHVMKGELTKEQLKLLDIKPLTKLQFEKMNEKEKEKMFLNIVHKREMTHINDWRVEKARKDGTLEMAIRVFLQNPGMGEVTLLNFLWDD